MTAKTVMQTRVIHAMTIPFTVQLASWEADEPASESTERPQHAGASRRARTADELNALLDAVMPRIDAHLRDVERRFSPFRADSLVGRARRGDWNALVTDPEFAEVYALCRQAKRLTDGAFDPMHAGEYDPTGIVKGWAVQRAYERFLQPLVRDGRVAAAAIGGGGDIQAGVNDRSNFVWRIGVDNPFRDGLRDDAYAPTVRTVTLRNGAVATSGTARRGEHITHIGERTDSTTDRLVQATVIDDQLIFADMWATAAISAGGARFQELAARHGGSRGGELMAVLVAADRSVVDIGGGH